MINLNEGIKSNNDFRIFEFEKKDSDKNNNLYGNFFDNSFLNNDCNIYSGDTFENHQTLLNSIFLGEQQNYSVNDESSNFN